ncbi:hypothetical protein K438DRAFT_1775488 [Mycena galopus ATCC 62051]|nr:hypothetical protein K438DRAFT_1775488 [Mycena galopus ATCC 62051]
MSCSGVTYYQEEPKDLLRLLKNLPDTIPIGDHHNFFGYAPDGKEVDEKGCCKTVVSHDIGRSFVPRPGLEQVVEVLRSLITGNGGPNALLTQWVDDLRHAARVAIEAPGNPTGLTALNAENPPDPSSNAFSVLGATLIDPHHDGGDITLLFFRDLLSDKPIAGARAVGSLAN